MMPSAAWTEVLRKNALSVAGLAMIESESPTHNKFVGETTFQTSSKKLAWLNGMKARHEGEYNPVAGENDFRLYGKR
jgi:hypothetical protein